MKERLALLVPLGAQVILQKYEYTNKKVFRVHTTLVSLKMTLNHVSHTDPAF